jgi:carbonic anhydrase
VIRRLKLPFGVLLSALLIAALVGIFVLAGCTAKNKSAIPANQREEYERPEKVESAVEAKKLLAEGNERFVSGEPAEKDLGTARREELTEGQKPFAVIVCCSDSRVPPEHVFDQGLGDIFVVRVAGNVADPVAIGSVEYAVEHLEVPLVVVLGHEKCGAVSATVEGGEAPGSIGSIVEKISPSVEKARAGNLEDEELIEKAVEFNVEQTIRDLKSSPIVTERRGKEELSILGATYELGSGEVKWL